MIALLAPWTGGVRATRSTPVRPEGLLHPAGRQGKEHGDAVDLPDMTSLFRERLPFVLAVVALCAVGPAAVLHFSAGEEAPFSAISHFALVAVSAGGAGGAALALTIVGARRGDAAVVLLATAFTAMTALLALHGLATPGVLVGPNGVVAFAGAATLPVGAVLLSLSALPGARGPRAVRRALILQGALITAIVGLGAVGLLQPDSVPSQPEAGSAPAVVLLVVGLAFFGVLAGRAASTLALTRRRSDLLVVLGTVWLGAALVAQLLLSPLSLAFYVGHALELLGVACVGAGVAADLFRTAASRPLVGDLRAAKLVESEEAFLGARMRSLLVGLARKDGSTEQHTRRVALLAVQVGDALGLPPARMRMLAVGGLLHDIGKLAVSDDVLKKPGPLNDDEFAQIKRHPYAGFTLLTQLGGFSKSVRRLVLDHHERLDGRGYPRGLHGDALDLETRILTVCDVYDALVSDRVYRWAWTTQEALNLLRRDTGTAFDARCVSALEELLRSRSAPLEPEFTATLTAEAERSPGALPAEPNTAPPLSAQQAAEAKTDTVIRRSAVSR